MSDQRQREATDMRSRKKPASRKKTDKRPMIREPFLPTSLTDDTKMDVEWSRRALAHLASQLTVANDFYYPLHGAINHLAELEQIKRAFITLVQKLGPQPPSSPENWT